MTAILRYDAACQAIAQAKSFDEVRDWEDKAAAVREYTRRARNRSMEIDAMEIRERARYRRGQLILDLKKSGRLTDGKPKNKTVLDRVPLAERVTLDELDVTKNESSRDQKLAQMGGDSFERLIKRCRSYAEEHPEKHSFNAPINGARSIMGSRHEPDDSLDYFPTPPWATRALMLHVITELPKPHLILNAFQAWEPACGEGHIAEVLKEFGDDVLATDIHDYGYGTELDFLGAAFAHSYDWIITNPPFNERAEAFVLRALEHARVGVAMFFRLQWLESVGRFERIFQPHSPTIIAQFAERVNLCKGRWEPEGTTATAYLWIVWLKRHKGPTRFMWIPPGCRESLTNADDVERFTAHPVIKRSEIIAPPNRENALTPTTPASMLELSDAFDHYEHQRPSP